MKRILTVILCAVMLISLAACGKKDGNETEAPGSVVSKEVVKISIELTDGRVMNAELYPKIAPITVQNFVDLARSGFYDGLIFHRVIKGFMIQGGDPKGNGTGGSGKTIKGEFAANGVKNDLHHTKGVLSMARRGKDASGNMNYDSATSQFFIVSGPDQNVAHLDGQYAAFGKLTDGYDVLEALESVPTDAYDKPLTDITIKTIKVLD